MKLELSWTQKQIKTLQKNHKKNEWKELEFVEGQSIEELKNEEKKLSREISKTKKEIISRSKAILLTEVALLPVVFLLIIASGMGPNLMSSIENQESFKSRYYVENLRGDTLDTWKSWRIVGTTLNVNIIAPGNISQEKVNVVALSLIHI